mmetsp:Transcript_20384/g.47698  ORF Transcript_20384/g.47698 Transcript_20384/m.47698 type:complete len:249 (+) Transcript_20384:184-930(+)
MRCIRCSIIQRRCTFRSEIELFSDMQLTECRRSAFCSAVPTTSDVGAAGGVMSRFLARSSACCGRPLALNMRCGLACWRSTARSSSTLRCWSSLTFCRASSCSLFSRSTTPPMHLSTSSRMTLRQAVGLGAVSDERPGLDAASVVAVLATTRLTVPATPVLAADAAPVLVADTAAVLAATHAMPPLAAVTVAVQALAGAVTLTLARAHSSVASGPGGMALVRAAPPALRRGVGADRNGGGAACREGAA